MFPDRERHIALLSNCNVDLLAMDNAEFYKLFIAAGKQVSRERLIGKNYLYRLKLAWSTLTFSRYVVGIVGNVKWNPEGTVEPKLALVTLFRDLYRSKGL